MSMPYLSLKFLYVFVNMILLFLAWKLKVMPKLLQVLQLTQDMIVVMNY